MALSAPMVYADKRRDKDSMIKMVIGIMAKKDR